MGTGEVRGGLGVEKRPGRATRAGPRRGRWLRSLQFFLLPRFGPPHYTYKSAKPGRPPRNLIGRCSGEDLVSASPVGDPLLSPVPAARSLSCWQSPREGTASHLPHPHCGDTSPCWYLALEWLKHKTLIFGAVFELSRPIRVERGRSIFQVPAAAAALAFGTNFSTCFPLFPSTR